MHCNCQDLRKDYFQTIRKLFLERNIPYFTVISFYSLQIILRPAGAALLMKKKDGRQVKITTEAGSEEIELEITDSARKGHVFIPHGFGLVYNGVKYGANVNRLTKNTHRDRFGTPIHRFVPCRVEAL